MIVPTSISTNNQIKSLFQHLEIVWREEFKIVDGILEKMHENADYQWKIALLIFIKNFYAHLF